MFNFHSRLRTNELRRARNAAADSEKNITVTTRIQFDITSPLVIES